MGKLTVAYDRTINAQYMNVEVGGACDPGNRRESFKVEKVSGTGQCEVSTWSRLQGGVPTDVDDPAWCGLAVIFYDPVVCRFTITEKKVCP